MNILIGFPQRNRCSKIWISQAIIEMLYIYYAISPYCLYTWVPFQTFITRITASYCTCVHTCVHDLFPTLLYTRILLHPRKCTKHDLTGEQLFSSSMDFCSSFFFLCCFFLIQKCCCTSHHFPPCYFAGLFTLPIRLIASCFVPDAGKYY